MHEHELCNHYRDIQNIILYIDEWKPWTPWTMNKIKIYYWHFMQGNWNGISWEYVNSNFTMFLFYPCERWEYVYNCMRFWFRKLFNLLHFFIVTFIKASNVCYNIEYVLSVRINARIHTIFLHVLHCNFSIFCIFLLTKDKKWKHNIVFYSKYNIFISG